MQTKTLFDKYGGFGTISKIVSEFYDRVLAEESLSPFFEKVDMARLMQHQTYFIGMVMGGPANQYTGRDLATAHSGLHISTEQFELVAHILQETLIDGGVEEQDVQLMMQSVAAAKKDIVS
jgi:hemoglobin